MAIAEFRIFTKQAQILLDNVVKEVNGKKLYQDPNSIWYTRNMELWVYDNLGRKDWADVILRARSLGYTAVPSSRFGTKGFISEYQDWLKKGETWEKMTSRLNELVELTGSFDRRVGMDLENYADGREVSYDELLGTIEEWRNEIAVDFLSTIRDQRLEPGIHPMFGDRIGTMLLAEEFLDAAGGKGTFQEESTLNQIERSLKSNYQHQNNICKNRTFELNVLKRWPQATYSIGLKDVALRFPSTEVIKELYSPVHERFWIDDENRADLDGNVEPGQLPGVEFVGKQEFFDMDYYTATSKLQHAYQFSGFRVTIEEKIDDKTVAKSLAWDRMGNNSFYNNSFFEIKGDIKPPFPEFGGKISPKFEGKIITDEQRNVNPTKGIFGSRIYWASIETLQHEQDYGGALRKFFPKALLSPPYTVVYDAVFDDRHGDWEKPKKIFNVNFGRIANVVYEVSPGSNEGKIVFKVNGTGFDAEKPIEFEVLDEDKVKPGEVIDCKNGVRDIDDNGEQFCKNGEPKTDDNGDPIYLTNNKREPIVQRFGISVKSDSFTCFWNDKEPQTKSGVVRPFQGDQGIFAGRTDGDSLPVIEVQEPIALYIYPVAINKLPSGDFPFFEQLDYDET